MAQFIKIPTVFYFNKFLYPLQKHTLETYGLYKKMEIGYIRYNTQING